MDAAEPASAGRFPSVRAGLAGVVNCAAGIGTGRCPEAGVEGRTIGVVADREAGSFVGDNLTGVARSGLGDLGASGILSVGAGRRAGEVVLSSRAVVERAGRRNSARRTDVADAGGVARGAGKEGRSGSRASAR